MLFRYTMAEHNELGKLGEELACKYFLERGYSIIEKNWRFGQDEIDLIVRDKDELVIVEVKTRISDFFENPQNAVTIRKQKFLIRAASNYMEKSGCELEVRFDIIAVIANKKEQRVDHIENAFYPLW